MADHTIGSGAGTVVRTAAVRDDGEVAERVSVMIVDDQPPFRDAARAVLSRVDGFELVAEVASGEEAVAASGELQPDLVLMDINMGELDGIEATRLITDARPATKVILVSTYRLDDLPLDRPHERGRRLRQQGRAVAPRGPPPLGGRRRPRLAHPA